MTPGTEAQAIEHAKRAATSVSDPGSVASAAKTPEQLVSQFTDDAPSKVFQSETIRYHAAVQADPVDPDWGPEAQADLQSFFSAEFAHDDPYVTAQCGTDLCELDVVANGNDSHAFMQPLRDMKQQPWWTGLGFDQEAGAMIFDNGRSVNVYFFSRK